MIVALLVLSFLLYWALFRKEKSFLVKPTLPSLVFYREYILLTMLPYVYYLNDNRWVKHYIFQNLDSNIYFYYASLFAFLFIVLFMLTYKLFQPSLESTFKRIRVQISFVKLKFFLNFLVLISFFYLMVVTFKYEAAYIGLYKFNTTELIDHRAYLSQGGGWLTLNKIAIKSWIPSINYLLFYLLFSKKVHFNQLDKFILFLSFFSGITASLWFFEKSVITFYFFGILGVYIYSGNILKKKVAIQMFIFSILLLGSMYILTYQSKIANFQYLYDIIIHRVASQSSGSVMAIHYFMSHDYLYLSGISNLLASINGSEFQSVYALIIDHYVPADKENSGAMSSFVTGDAFGLFGFIGVLISGIIVGIYYAFFEATKASDFFSVIFVGIYGIYFSHFIVASSFYSFLWPVGILFDIFPFIFIALFSIRQTGASQSR